jgi:electron transport complex protein RnfD
MRTKSKKAHDNMRKIMQDVLLALLPCAAISWLAYGWVTILLIAVAVISALSAEFLFTLIFKGDASSVRDGSSVITAVLMSFTLAPFTPWYVVAFGAAMAVIFGKLLWGGMGTNRMNPALLGREFMTVFFPAVMGLRTLWYDKDLLKFSDLNLFGFAGHGKLSAALNYLSFNPSGAIGEYSLLLLSAGGLFLLLRKRITWHIPFAITVMFFVLAWVFRNADIRFSVGGVLLGAVFMATDMPTCAKTPSGKLYYGAMIAVTAVLFLLNNIRYEYMSYAILLLNLFAKPIDSVLKPQLWASRQAIPRQLLTSLLLTVGILAAAYILVLLYRFDAIRYLLFVLIIYLIATFIRRESRSEAVL